MTDSNHSTFANTIVGGALLLFLLAAVLGPPDPFTQLYAVAAGLPVVLLAAYLLAYRGGYETLQRAL